MLPIFKEIIILFAKPIASEVVGFVKTEFDILKQDFIQYQKLKEEFSERDKIAMELKNDIKLAKTPQERDVLLDKMDKLFRSTINF